MLTYIADFALGLFVGVYALASFAPKQKAREVYRTCWFFCGAFVILAYLAEPIRPDVRGHKDASSILGLSNLEWMVILGIAVAFIGGMQYLKKSVSAESN